MSRRAWLYIVGSVSVPALAGCGGGWFMQQREPWRHDAEVACLQSGQVKITPAVAQLPAISGPGICGADFPLKVSALGDSAVLGFADDLRPPADIPSVPQAGPRPAAPGYGYPQASGRDPYSQPYRPSSPAQQQQAAYPPYAVQPQVAYPAQPGAPISLKPPGMEDDDDAADAAPATPTYSRPGSVTRSTLPPPSSLAPRPYSAREGTYDPPRAQPPEPYYTPPPRTYGAPGNETPQYGAPRSGAPARNFEPLPPLGPQTPTLASGPATVQPPATLACPMVSALDQWMSSSVQPAAVRWFGQPVVEVRQISAYSCRGMNGNPHAHISEHAFGNALDIAAFTLADGRKVTVKDGWRGLPEERGFLRDVHAAACQQFTTVLGPGSNVYHYDHLHVDLMRRSSGQSICNPAAVPGDVVAGWRGGQLVTGSIGRHSASLGYAADDGAPRGRTLSRAVAGED